MRTLLTSILWAGVAWANVSARGGLAWTVQRLEGVGTNPPPQFRGVAYGNGRYAALTFEGEIYSAPASLPLVWTRDLATTNATLRDVIFAQGSFRVVGLDRASGRALVLSSITGTNWSGQTLPTNQEMYRIEFGKGQFVGIGGDTIF